MRYVSIPSRGRTKATFVHYEHDLGYHSLTADTVVEQDDAPMLTGLLDSNGTPIYRVPERRQIGFDLTGRKT